MLKNNFYTPYRAQMHTIEMLSKTLGAMCDDIILKIPSVNLELIFKVLNIKKIAYVKIGKKH